jgi:tRNA pseudouridine55 synthase
VDGILLFDKPVGMTSNAALQSVKRLYQAAKAGHTGSLDPLADGLLPICFGMATKVSAFLLDADKHYVVRARLGVKTTTADREGEVVETRAWEHLVAEDIEAGAQGFRGEISQLPPMYSALKHQGQRLYDLARQGIEVVREPRQVTIHALRITHIDLPEVEFEVHCSKGTYVRTLVEDIGEVLGCGAHVVALRRTGVAGFTGCKMHTLERLQEIAAGGTDALDALLLPLDAALGHVPAVQLSESMAYYLRQGQPVQVPKAPGSGLVRIYAGSDRFLGVGEIDADGRVAPKRLLQGTG